MRNFIIVLREFFALIWQCIGPILLVFLYNAVFFFLLGIGLNITLEGLEIITHPLIPSLHLSPPPTHCAAFLVILRVLLKLYRQFIPNRRKINNIETHEFAFKLTPTDTNIIETERTSPHKIFWLNKAAFIINLFIDLVLIRFFLFI